MSAELVPVSVDVEVENVVEEDPIEDNENSLNNIPQSAFPYLENIVASCESGAEVDLKSVALRVRNAEYNPRKVGQF
jgi:hypothetical protein